MLNAIKACLFGTLCATLTYLVGLYINPLTYFVVAWLFFVIVDK